MSDNIEIAYKGAKILFDTSTEEWVARMNIEGYSPEDTLKRHKSLQKLKDAIDRFNKKDFKPIPILMFKDYSRDNEMKNADIISFTSIPGECWVKYHDGRREKINTIKSRFSIPDKIYACGHVFNEPILTKIAETTKEIERIEKELAQKKKERVHLIDSLEPFDIGGKAEPEDENEN